MSLSGSSHNSLSSFQCWGRQGLSGAVSPMALPCVPVGCSLCLAHLCSGVHGKKHGNASPSFVCQMISCRSVRIQSKSNLVGELVFEPSPLRTYSPLLWGPQLFVSAFSPAFGILHLLPQLGFDTLTGCCVRVDRSIITTGL